MIALLCFVMAILAAPFKSKSRLEAENAALRHQLIVLRRKVPNSDRSFFVSMVPVDLECSNDRPSRDPRALASCRFSLLLALEIAPTGRAAPD